LKAAQQKVVTAYSASSHTPFRPCGSGTEPQKEVATGAPPQLNIGH
jgi:hypothetical protein